ncbi:hypothetical protein, partial [Parabacteroides distasonis]|uniref:hypothetical protein n=1 Tax=Parabacteroides distasonis TaxID=823 RepID=UPI0039B58D5C
MILKLEIAKIHLLSGNGEQIRKRIATDHAKHTTVYFISHPAKVVPCPVYPVKVRPLAGLAESKYSINSLVYWVTYVHNVVYSFYRSM